MFRSKRGSDASTANAGDPVEELGALLDKVQLTVDTWPGGVMLARL